MNENDFKRLKKILKLQADLKRLDEAKNSADKNQLQPQPPSLSKDKKTHYQLHKLRLKNKLSIHDLSKKMGVSEEYLTKVEMGLVNPPAEQFETIEAFLQEEL